MYCSYWHGFILSVHPSGNEKLLTSSNQSPGDDTSGLKQSRQTGILNPKSMLLAVYEDVPLLEETTQLILMSLSFYSTVWNVISFKVYPLPPKLHQTLHTEVAPQQNTSQCPHLGYAEEETVEKLRIRSIVNFQSIGLYRSSIHNAQCSYPLPANRALCPGDWWSLLAFGVLLTLYHDVPVWNVNAGHYSPLPTDSLFEVFSLFFYPFHDCNFIQPPMCFNFLQYLRC